MQALTQAIWTPLHGRSMHWGQKMTWRRSFRMTPGAEDQHWESSWTKREGKDYWMACEKYFCMYSQLLFPQTLSLDKQNCTLKSFLKPHLTKNYLSDPTDWAWMRVDCIQIFSVFKIALISDKRAWALVSPKSLYTSSDTELVKGCQ